MNADFNILVNMKRRSKWAGTRMHGIGEHIESIISQFIVLLSYNEWRGTWPEIEILRFAWSWTWRHKQTVALSCVSSYHIINWEFRWEVQVSIPGLIWLFSSRHVLLSIVLPSALMLRHMSPFDVMWAFNPAQKPCSKSYQQTLQFITQIHSVECTPLTPRLCPKCSKFDKTVRIQL